MQRLPGASFASFEHRIPAPADLQGPSPFNLHLLMSVLVIKTYYGEPAAAAVFIRRNKAKK